MGLFGSDNDDSSAGTTTFKPVATDGTMVLGHLNDPNEDELQLVWINGREFDKIDSNEIDRIVE